MTRLFAMVLKAFLAHGGVGGVQKVSVNCESLLPPPSQPGPLHG